jgi:hypothetical protein
MQYLFSAMSPAAILPCNLQYTVDSHLSYGCGWCRLIVHPKKSDVQNHPVVVKFLKKFINVQKSKRKI